MKDQEEIYWKEQSNMLQISLDFWQHKVIEQIEYCDNLSVDEDQDILNQSNAELDYFLAKLSWDSLEMEKMDVKITDYLKRKKKKDL